MYHFEAEGSLGSYNNLVVVVGGELGQMKQNGRSRGWTVQESRISQESHIYEVNTQ